MNKSNSFSNHPTSLLRGSSSSVSSSTAPGTSTAAALPVPVEVTSAPLGPPLASTPPAYQPQGILSDTASLSVGETPPAASDALPTFAIANDQWKSDLTHLASLADSTLLLAMDVSHIPTHLAHASPNVHKFLGNLRTITRALHAAEQALSAAEQSLALPAADLKAWEDQVLRVGALVEEMRVVAGEYQDSDAGLPKGDAAPQRPPVAAVSSATATAAQERAQLLGLSDPSSSSGFPTRVARVTLATRHGLNTAAPRGPNDSPDNDPGNPYEHLQARELVQVQSALMDDQDAQLDALAHVVGRQKHVALEMHDELEDQVGLLDDMDGQAERVGSRLRVERRRVEEVGRKVTGGGMWGVICVLVIVLVLLIVVL